MNASRALFIDDSPKKKAAEEEMNRQRQRIKEGDEREKEGKGDEIDEPELWNEF